jgi:hypothetical protein
MKRSASAILAAASLALAACGGPATVQELAGDVVARLATQDFLSFSDALVATPQEYVAVCPQLTSYSVDLTKHQERFNRCLSKAEWTGADITNVLPTMGFAPQCGAQVEYATDVQVTVTTRLNIYTFKIDSAVRTKGGWKLTAPLICD